MERPPKQGTVVDNQFATQGKPLRKLYETSTVASKQLMQ